MRPVLLTIALIILYTISYSQTNSFQPLLDSGKAEFKHQSRADTSDYTKAYALLKRAVDENPSSAEARYFLGYAIDRMNSNDGSSMTRSRRTLTELASEQFEKAIRLEEEYKGEIIILDPYAKLGSIWGSLAQAYIARDLQDSAVWAFKEGKKRGGFIEPLLEFNRQMLKSCSKNAMLITSGDNLTICCWYLQMIENLRPDVTVIDGSLIYTPWYAKYIKNVKKVAMQLTSAEIDSLSYLQWTAQDIEIVHPVNSSRRFKWTMKPTYMDQYILSGDRILLDIFKHNVYKRDIYFNYPSDTTYNLHLENYLKQQGLVYWLETDKPEVPEFSDVERNLRLYDISKLNANEIKRSQDAITTLSGYRFAYVSHAYNLYIQGRGKDAFRVIKEMETKFPPSKLPYHKPDFVTKLEYLKSLLEGQ